MVLSCEQNMQADSYYSHGDDPFVHNDQVRMYGGSCSEIISYFIE